MATKAIIARHSDLQADGICAVVSQLFERFVCRIWRPSMLPFRYPATDKTDGRTEGTTKATDNSHVVSTFMLTTTMVRESYKAEAMKATHYGVFCSDCHGSNRPGHGGASVVSLPSSRIMSFWTRNPYEADAELADSLSHSPSGGRVKMWLLGVGLALLPISYGIYCLHTGHAILPGQNSKLDVTGSGSVALAIAYIAVGVFIHAHWFWGLYPKFEWLSPILKVVATLVFLGGLGYAGYEIIAL